MLIEVGLILIGMSATHSLQNVSREKLYFEEYGPTLSVFTLVGTFCDYKMNELHRPTCFKYVIQILLHVKVKIASN